MTDLLAVLLMRASITKVLLPKITIRKARLVIGMINKKLKMNRNLHLPENGRKDGDDHGYLVFSQSKQKSKQVNTQRSIFLGQTAVCNSTDS